MQKPLKNARRRPTKCRNREKTLIVGQRNAENAEKRSSSGDEMLKTTKNARRRATKHKKTRKTTFRTPTTSRKRKKQPFVPLR